MASRCKGRARSRAATVLAIGAFVLVIAAGACREASGEQGPRAHPAVLFVCGEAGPTCQLHTWDDWVSAGFDVAVLPVAKAASSKVLRRFNAVVIDFLPNVDSRRHVSPAQEAFERTLRPYLERGGGAVVFAGGGEWGWMTPAVNHLLEPYGARVPDEQVVDPGHVVARIGIQGRKLAVAMTHSITAAPMTRGISRLGYLSQTVRADAMKLTQPVILDPGTPWRVIVRADPTAWSAVARTAGNKVELRRAASPSDAAPILAAARSVGEGRLFLFPHNVAPTVASPEVFESYLWNPRDRTEKDAPQNRSFIMQVVRWAAQPSLDSGVFGGYRTDPRLRPERMFRLPAGQPIDWAKAPTGPALAKSLGDFRGLIGAQSTFSGGASTVAELSTAARSAGLSFLGFTERLDRLDAAKWAKLKEACERESGTGFLAIPGIEARDGAGNLYFALGWGPFPAPPAITPGGDRIDSLYRFWATTFGTRLVGVVDVGENPNPWFEVKQVSAFAVKTVRGAHTDDATEGFLRSSYDMENYVPISFTEVHSPAEVESAAAGLVNVFGGRSLEDLRGFVAGSGPYSGHAMFWACPHLWYLSSGPRLLYDGGIRLGAAGVDEEAENTYRYGFRIEGLAKGDQILLMDGPTVYRHWESRGAEFTTEHTWPHEQVRAFVIRVVRSGRTLLVGSPVTLQWGRRFNQSGDRQNTIPYNYEPDAHGDWYVATGGLGPKYKAWPPHTALACTRRIHSGAVGIEYQVNRSIGWGNVPIVPFAGRPEPRGGSFASYQYQRLSCPGIVVVDEVMSRAYPNGAQHPPDSAPPERTRPLERFELAERRYGLYGAIGQINGQLVESRIRVLKDATLDEKAPLVGVSRFNRRPERGATVELRSDGTLKRYAVDGKTRIHVEKSLRPGDFMGLVPAGPSDGGAQYAVSGPLLARLGLGPGVGLQADLLLPVPSHWKAGQSLDYGILYTSGSCAGGRSFSDYQAVGRFLGLDGSFPAIHDLSGGTLLPEPVIATIRTNPSSVVRFATPLEPDAPLGLPIRLRGYNPNWQVVYRLDGSSHWRYMGELDGDFYFHLYTQQRAHTVVAGQPLLADQPQLRITLDDPLGRQSAFELYNPTSQPMKARLHTNPAFFAPRQFDVTVPPYTSTRVRLDGSPVTP